MLERKKDLWKLGNRSRSTRNEIYNTRLIKLLSNLAMSLITTKLPNIVVFRAALRLN
jgi:hypothetical protein